MGVSGAGLDGEMAIDAFIDNVSGKVSQSFGSVTGATFDVCTATGLGGCEVPGSW